MAGQGDREIVRVVGRRLRGLRIELDLSREEVARRMGWSGKNYGHYESGRSNLKVGKLSELAEALGVTEAVLVSRLGLLGAETGFSGPSQPVRPRRRRQAGEYSSKSDHTQTRKDRFLTANYNYHGSPGPLRGRPAELLRLAVP